MTTRQQIRAAFFQINDIALDPEAPDEVFEACMTLLRCLNRWTRHLEAEERVAALLAKLPPIERVDPCLHPLWWECYNGTLAIVAELRRGSAAPYPSV